MRNAKDAIRGFAVAKLNSPRPSAGSRIGSPGGEQGPSRQMRDVFEDDMETTGISRRLRCACVA
jgi:hypothetical protein